jgi:hypothetical protein
MLGEMSVDVNGMCLDRTVSYVLMIERRQVKIICSESMSPTAK